MGPILAFAPDADTPGRHDVSGAFLPEALQFLRLHDPSSLPVRRFPAAGPLDERRVAVKHALRERAEQGAPLLKTLAFFSHGFRTGLQCGYLSSNALKLAQLVKLYCKPGGYVVLYACDTGRDSDMDTEDDRMPGPGGEGGFADALRDACDALNCQTSVVAHATRGHCTMNPHVRIFRPGGYGGEWYVDPGDAALFLRWRKALHSISTLRFRFPFMTSEAIRDELTPRVA